MITVREFRPTGFDHATGEFSAMADYQDWYVIATRTRDSDVLSESNFACLARDYPEAETFRFGHWACGWYEILAHPSREVAETVEAALDNYPIWDEGEYSARDWEESCRVWEVDGAYIVRHDMTDVQRPTLEWLCEHPEVARDFFEWDGDWFRYLNPSRDDIAKVIRKGRRAQCQQS